MNEEGEGTEAAEAQSEGSEGNPGSTTSPEDEVPCAASPSEAPLLQSTCPEGKGCVLLSCTSRLLYTGGSQISILHVYKAWGDLQKVHGKCFS